MPALRFRVLSTGSRGNCAFIASPASRVLVDCGIPLRDVKAGLAEIGADLSEVDALFLTHTHSDHISCVPRLLRRQPLRVYCPAAHLRTLAALLARERVSAELTPVGPGEGFHHRDLDVLPVPVSHDCSPTVMYRFHCGRRSVGLLTDLGFADARLGQLFSGCDALLLESNHCVEMLRRGRYPESLKRRIRGELGHLSNDQAAQFAAGLSSLPPRLLLGHLSDDNNCPAAASAAFARIEYGGMIPHTVIPQRTAAPVIEIAA